MGCEPFLVAASLEGVLAQRLVRTICPDCRTPYEPSSTILSQLGVSPYELGAKHFFTGAARGFMSFWILTTPCVT